MFYFHFVLKVTITPTLNEEEKSNGVGFSKNVYISMWPKPLGDYYESMKFVEKEDVFEVISEPGKHTCCNYLTSSLAHIVIILC